MLLSSDRLLAHRLLPQKRHPPGTGAIRSLKARAMDSITFYMLPKPLLGREQIIMKGSAPAWLTFHWTKEWPRRARSWGFIYRLYLLGCLPKSYPNLNEVVLKENSETDANRRRSTKSLKAINFKWSQLYQSCGYNFLLTLIITFQWNICLKKAKSLHYFLFLAWLQKYSLI